MLLQNIFGFSQAAKLETVLQYIFTLLLFWPNIFPFYAHRQYDQTTIRVLYFLKVHAKSCDQHIIHRLVQELENVLYLSLCSYIISPTVHCLCLLVHCARAVFLCKYVLKKTCNDEGRHAGNMTHTLCADTEQIGWAEKGRAGGRDILPCISFFCTSFLSIKFYLLNEILEYSQRLLAQLLPMLTLFLSTPLMCGKQRLAN